MSREDNDSSTPEEQEEIGLFVMRLIDRVNSSQRARLDQSTDEFLKLLPSRIQSYMTISKYQAETLLRELGGRLASIVQNDLNNLSIKLARQIRGRTKTEIAGLRSQADDLQEIVNEAEAQLVLSQQMNEDQKTELMEIAERRNEELLQQAELEKTIESMTSMWVEEKQRYVDEAEESNRAWQAKLDETINLYQAALQESEDTWSKELKDKTDLWQLKLTEGTVELQSLQESSSTEKEKLQKEIEDLQSLFDELTEKRAKGTQHEAELEQKVASLTKELDEEQLRFVDQTESSEMDWQRKLQQAIKEKEESWKTKLEENDQSWKIKLEEAKQDNRSLRDSHTEETKMLQAEIEALKGQLEDVSLKREEELRHLGELEKAVDTLTKKLEEMAKQQSEESEEALLTQKKAKEEISPPSPQ